MTPTLESGRSRPCGDDRRPCPTLLGVGSAHPEVPVGLVVRGAQVERLESVARGPGQRVGLDVAVVERHRLGLDADVDLGHPLRVRLVHPLQVEALVDEVELRQPGRGGT